MWVYFWAVYSIPLIFMLFSHQCHTALIIVASQDCLKFERVMPLGLFVCLFVFASRFLWQFWVFCGSIKKIQIICFSSEKNVMGSLIGITLNLQISLDSIAILTILILPIQEHRTSFNLFQSSLISFISVLQFLAYVFHLLGQVYSKVFFFFLV